MINLSEQIQFSRERMSVSALAVVEFSLAAAKIECADEIHARENLKVARMYHTLSRKVYLLARIMSFDTVWA